MCSSIAGLVATFVPVAGTILGLLAACFGIIIAVGLFAKLAGSPARKILMLLAVALVALGALRYVSGPRRGGRTLWRQFTSWQHRTDAKHAHVEAQASHEQAIPQVMIDKQRHAIMTVEDRLDEAAARAAMANADVPVHILKTDGTELVVDVPRPPAAVRVTDSGGARHAIREGARDLRRWVRSRERTGLAGTLLTSLGLAAFLFVGYVFLDAGTRGQFTWSLRIVCGLAFLIFAAALARWPIF